MRFVLALFAFVAAAGMIALGIAQRTVLLPPPRAVVTAAVADGVRYVVIPGSALRAHPGQQRLRIEGDGTVFAAYARSSDVTAWLAGERYQRVGITSKAATASRVLATAPPLTGVTAGEHPDPAGSDLWLDEQRAEKSLDWTVNVPASVSLLIAADGASPAPGRVTLSWPVRTSTPYATPLIVGGSVLVVVGLLLYIWALVHLKRTRGPRRKSPRGPMPPASRIATPRPTTDRAGSLVRRMLATCGVTAAGALLLAGCSAPPAAPVSAATAGAPVVAAPTGAITAAQAQRIVRDAAVVAARADRARKASLLTPRFMGSALALRKAAYAVRKYDKRYKLPQALPTTSASIALTLPQRTDAWPRALFAVLTDTAKDAGPPLALTLVQLGPRQPYRVQYAMSLVQGALPNLPTSVAGASRVRPDTTLLRVAPGELAEDYGLLLRSPKAKPAALFDLRNDRLMKEAGAGAKKRISKQLGATARIRFTNALPDPTKIVALATADAGAIVSVHLVERWTVKPLKKGVTVKPSGATKALSRVTSTAKGIVSTYGYQLLFSVPPAGSDRRVQLLGYAQGLTSAKEL